MDGNTFSLSLENYYLFDFYTTYLDYTVHSGRCTNNLRNIKQYKINIGNTLRTYWGKNTTVGPVLLCTFSFCRRVLDPLHALS